LEVPPISHIFAKWPVGQKQFDHAGLRKSTTKRFPKILLDLLHWLIVAKKITIGRGLPLGNIGEASLVGYTHGKAAQRSSKVQVAWLHLPCLIPSCCGASRFIWDCCWPWVISSLPI